MRSGKRWRAATAAMVAALMLSACGSGGSTQSDADRSESAGFPVTITHEYGTITVPTKPLRIVSLSTSGNAIASALGTPAVLEKKNVNSPTGRDSWLPAANPQPELMNTFTGVNIEQVASMRPDLIIATDVQSKTSRENYDKLSRIAPTIARQSDGETATLLSVGDALGNRAAVQRMIDDADAEREATVQKYPGLKDVSVAYGLISDNTIGVQLDKSLTTSVAFLEGLGLTLPGELVQSYREKKGLPGPPGTFVFSWESTAMLASSRLIMMSTYGDGVRGRFEQSAAYRALPATQRGDFNFLDIEVVAGLQLAGPYNTKWLLGKLDPALRHVVGQG